MRENHITEENLADTLISILERAPELMQEYIADPLWSGAMVSKDTQKKMIKAYCGYKTDSVKYKKMIAYRKACNRAKSMENVKENPAAERYFREMGLSPLYCSEEAGCIPSFSDLLAGTETETTPDYANFCSPVSTPKSSSVRLTTRILLQSRRKCFRHHQIVACFTAYRTTFLRRYNNSSIR